MSDQEQKTTIRSVFGKELDVSQLEGMDIRQLMGSQRMLDVQGGDPNYEYGWLDVRDPMTSMKTRKGLWEIVNPENEPDLVAPSALNTDGQFRVNELVLARMPKARYQAMKAASRALSLRRQAGVQEGYKASIKGISGRISPDQTGSPSLSVKEEVRKGRRVTV